MLPASPARLPARLPACPPIPARPPACRGQPQGADAVQPPLPPALPLRVAGALPDLPRVRQGHAVRGAAVRPEACSLLELLAGSHRSAQLGARPLSSTIGKEEWRKGAGQPPQSTQPHVAKLAAAGQRQAGQPAACPMQPAAKPSCALCCGPPAVQHRFPFHIPPPSLPPALPVLVYSSTRGPAQLSRLPCPSAELLPATTPPPTVQQNPSYPATHPLSPKLHLPAYAAAPLSAASLSAPLHMPLVWASL